MRGRVFRADDDRWMVAVIFQRETPDDQEPQIEVIYHLHWPSDFTLHGDPFVLAGPLSITRKDTRETVEITQEETVMVLDAAVEAADQYNQNLVAPP